MEPFCGDGVYPQPRGRMGLAGGVSSPDELRSYAVDCARLARAAALPHDKARLLNMARAWTELADRLEKLSRIGSDVGGTGAAGKR